MLSFGRPVPYKRLDLSLRAAAEAEGAFHPVVVTLGDAPGLEALRDALGVPATVVNAFDFDLVACLCQHERTVVTAILAKNEPFGLIPSEARLLARRQGGLLLVPADGGGLAEQVRDERDGFVLELPVEPRAVAEAVARIQAFPEDRKRAIRRAGTACVFEGGYTWSARILETLARLDPAVAAVKDVVKAEIAERERTALEA